MLSHQTNPPPPPAISPPSHLLKGYMSDRKKNVLCSITNSPLEAAQLYVHQEMQIPQRTAVW